jgi:hypothetical protein
MQLPDLSRFADGLKNSLIFRFEYFRDSMWDLDSRKAISE